jgi:O-antigen ligase
MYTMFSIGIVYEILLKKKKLSLKVIGGYLIIGYLIVLTLHLASRISILILPCVIVMFLVQIIRQHKIQSLWIILPIFIGIVVLFNLRLFALTSRLENGIGNPFKLPGPESSDTRSMAWYSSLEIIKNNFLFGVGTGDATAELNTIYNNLGKPSLAEVNLNSHNQYFDSLIRNGIFGLVGLLLLYFYGPFDVRFRSWLYGVFLLVIVLTSVTENILDRQKGVVFFAVFNALLYRYCKND